MYLDRHLRKTQIIWPERQGWQRYKSRNDWYRQAGLGHIKAYCELSYSSCLSVSRHNINLALNYVSWLYFVWAGDSSSTIGTVALSEWMDVPLLVSAGSCHWNQHRSWETIPLLVRTVICSYNLYVFYSKWNIYAVRQQGYVLCCLLSLEANCRDDRLFQEAEGLIYIEDIVEPYDLPVTRYYRLLVIWLSTVHRILCHICSRKL